ncbi:hypothetical protein MUK42_32760 [Musa troglodytarum]|uniref:Uncharacterized protein n=1 Tax=Musa troglodytarum TaxID=320322 RepID=A0A9E7JSZ7_9LILI|nr:hypothetical protein MUK42_32760 [Musa troglodytarum]
MNASYPFEKCQETRYDMPKRQWRWPISSDLAGSAGRGRLDNDDPRAWAGCCSVERPHGANDRASELEYGTVTFGIKFGPMRAANRFGDRGFLPVVTSD